MDKKLIDNINLNYFKNKKWSFSGPVNVYRNHKDELSLNDARNVLSYNDIYTRFKRHKRAKKYSPVYVYQARELFQADVVFFTNSELVKVNSGYKYLFTCIDCFTKYR